MHEVGRLERKKAVEPFIGGDTQRVDDTRMDDVGKSLLNLV